MKNELKTYNDKNFKCYNDKKFPNYLIVETSFNSLLYKVNDGDKKDSLIYKFEYGEKASVTNLLFKCLNHNTSALLFMREKVHRNFWKDEQIQETFFKWFDIKTKKMTEAYKKEKKSDQEIKFMRVIRSATMKKYQEFFNEVNKTTVNSKIV